jgi:hypothetical protein
MMHIIVLCALLPYLHGWLVVKTKDSATADLLLGRGSVAFLTLGALGMGLAGTSTGIILCKFGNSNVCSMLSNV